MKQVPTELLNYLHAHTEFYKCDLYEITMQSGLVFRYAGYGKDITLPDGRFFSHKGPIFKRNQIKLSSEIGVDKLTITVYVDQTDTVGETPTMHVAHNGGFDEAQLTLLRCIMSAPGVVVGAVAMFGGSISVDKGGALEMKWTVKSGVQRLNVEYPLRKYYPTCPHSIYDASCGLKIEDFTLAGSVTAVSSYQEFTTDVIKLDKYFEQGGVMWLTGALAGVSAPVETSYQDGRIVMMLPMDAAPAVGDTFKIYPGCDKIPDTCKNKFNNLSHNRATPYIPLKETIV